MPADYLFNLYQPVDKVIAINYNPRKIIQIRSENLSSQDLLVILGSHYFGPHLNAIYKNCFDIKCKK